MSQQIPFDETDVPDEAMASPQQTKSAPANQPATDKPPDLSAEIARAVERRPGEQVTCRRVGDHHYRCNWWALQNTSSFDNPGMKGSLVLTSRISQSEFLHVTRTGARLKIRVDTRAAAGRRFWFGA